MNYHFIAVGGAVMHNLALALHAKGHTVTGSDDEIFDPAQSRLRAAGILPDAEGWFPQKLTPEINAVIVGMHARADNPELVRARQLDLKVYSFPEYLYEHARNKKRVVIGGSHGKTTITAMVMHVLKYCGCDFDYLVGAQVQGFEVMVRISDEAPVMIYEGDEYLTAPFDPRPKFHLYHPHIALISGIAWDHINVFPDFEEYVEQFRIFAGQASDALIYNQEDPLVLDIAMELEKKVLLIPYETPHYTLLNEKAVVTFGGRTASLQIFGRHNMVNLSGALEVCKELGISEQSFYKAIQNFGGAQRRLERINNNGPVTVYRDFAHSPSKLKATVSAAKELAPSRRLVACFELHTYSSLNPDFLPHYKGTMDEADIAVIYYSPHAAALKRLPPIASADIIRAFNKPGMLVFSDPDHLKEYLQYLNWTSDQLLMMSSGNFDGLDLAQLAMIIGEQ